MENTINISKKIFMMINEFKWDEIKNLIKIIDVNIKNINGLYLIYYGILFNKLDIIELILLNDPVIDYIDIEGKTILYIPIKMYYNDIFDKLVEYNKKIIGIDIINIQDSDKNTPLHYSIIYNNIYTIDKLLIAGANIIIKNINGNTPLHIAVNSKYDVIEKLLNSKMCVENPNFVNIQNKNGETPLHIACNFELINIVKLLIGKKADINIYDITHLTPLFYAITLNNFEIVKLLVENGADVNFQDINGNMPIMYAYKEKNEKIFNFIYNKFTKYNITNINGRTILHSILYDILEDIKIIDKFNIEGLLINTDLNLQDNNGNSCLHLIFQTSIYEKYRNILEKKKLNMFVINKYNQIPFDFIKNKDEIIDLIIKAYLYVLRENKTEWEFEYDKECSKPKLKNNRDLCYEDIKKIILEKKISIPVKLNRFRFTFDENIKNLSTYTGIILDILMGILYLHNKYKLDPFTSSITLNFFDNEIVKKHYQTIGYEYKFDFYNFEILWSYQSLLIPTNLKYQLLNENKYRFFIIPIGIEMSIGAHSNIIIIDNKLKEIERFEPIGSEHPFEFNYNPVELDRQLKYFLKDILKDYKYISPLEFLPKIGFQSIETSEHYQHKKIGDPNGFCAGWANWWADMRMTYPNIPREKLVIKLMKKIKSMNLSFKNLIRQHTNNITELRDEILKDIDLDINDWLNDNYTEEQIKTLIKKLESIISKL
jgi:ankyrin repeat protein